MQQFHLFLAITRVCDGHISISIRYTWRNSLACNHLRIPPAKDGGTGVPARAGKVRGLTGEDARRSIVIELRLDL